MFNGELAYWKQALRDCPAMLQLPADHPRPPRQTFKGDSTHLLIPADVLREFTETCRGRQATLFMGLLAVWQALLCRYSGMTDIVVGSPIANREPVETEPLIGVFINTLALRTDLSDDPAFPGLLDRVRQTALAAYENRHVPFAAVIEAVQPKRSVSQPGVSGEREEGSPMSASPHDVYPAAVPSVPCTALRANVFSGKRSEERRV